MDIHLDVSFYTAMHGLTVLRHGLAWGGNVGLFFVMSLQISAAVSPSLAASLPSEASTPRTLHLSQIIIRPDIDIYLPIPRRDRDRRYEPRSLPFPPDALPTQNTSDCTTLTVMARLAYMSDPFGRLSDEVSSRQLAVCQGFGDSRGIPQWSNGQVARLGSSWSYPNRQTATFGNSYNYPNGQSANSGSSWSYPNGRTAKFGSVWYDPDGRSLSQEELLSWACGLLGSGRCRDRLSAMQGAGNFWYELTLVELAWLGYQYPQN
ncbi:hypothetical protein ACQ4M4_06475 [Leptolyngbya sp. AN02str]|uniref:hypothetical protein n=1 Tax=Leptolyngbya sp. AN02str TaxID=3423363 RepID=UPI003D3129C6